jgi:hypothetical protein
MLTGQAQEEAVVAARAAIQSAIKNGLPIDLDGDNVVSSNIILYDTNLRNSIVTGCLKGELLDGSSNLLLKVSNIVLA